MIITVTNSGLPNRRPTQIGAKTIDNIANDGEHVFTISDFTDTTPEYIDPEGDPLSYVKIQSLASSGTLKLNGVAVSKDDLIYSGDISLGNLTFEPDSSLTTTSTGVFKFDCADAGSGDISGLNTGIMRLNVIAKVYSPPSNVGDSILTTEHNTPLFLTTDDFTNNYSHPDNRPAFNLKILTMPLTGSLTHDSSAVVVNQIIPFSEILLNKLVYVPDVFSLDEHQVDFDFAITDSLSNQYTQ